MRTVGIFTEKKHRSMESTWQYFMIDVSWTNSLVFYYESPFWNAKQGMRAPQRVHASTLR